MTGKRKRPDAASDTIARPPLLYGGALVVSFVLDILFPMGILSFGAQWGLGASVLIAGIGLGIVSAGQFRLHGTPVPTYLPTRALVTDGVYARSRNPMYIALTLIYLGFALLMDMPVALLLLIPVLHQMITRVIPHEEAYLESKFGDDYHNYKSRVRRWL